MLRQVRSAVVCAVLTVLPACVDPDGTPVSPPPAKVTQAIDELPPYAVSAAPHVGSLTVHSSTRDGGDQMPSPSPDGSWFAFASTRNSKEPQIYRQSSSGSVVTQLTQGPKPHIQPAVGPGGGEIAFAGPDVGSWDVWIMPAGGGARENVTSTPDLDEINPAWHPGGKTLAFNCRRSDEASAGRDEWWICAKTRGSAGVSWIAPGFNPCWSPAGDVIAYQRARQRGREEHSLWIVRVAVDVDGLVSGGAESQIVANPDWGAVEPEFSPDGRWIAFTAVDLGQPGDEAPRGGDIWCVHVDGTDLTRLTHTPEADWDPAWAGVNGNATTPGRLFFASERTGHMNIWSILPALDGLPATFDPTGR